MEIKTEENCNALFAQEAQDQTIHCLNCRVDYHGDYCPQCGQTAKTKRLSFRNILNGVMSVFLKRDNKTARTCWELIVRPGIVARNFILGQRGRYNAPMPLLIALVAIYSLAVHYMPDAASPFSSFKIEVTQTVEVNEDTESSTDSINAADHKEKKVTRVISVWNPEILEYLDLDVVILLAIQEIMGNIVYHVVLSSLLCTLPYWWVFRRRKLLRPDGQELTLNTAEHFFALFYLACISVMLAFVSLPLNFIPGLTTHLNIILGILPSVIGVYMYRQLLNLSWSRSVWLNLLASLLTIVLIVLLLCLIIFGTEYMQRLFAADNTAISTNSNFSIDWDFWKKLFN